MGTFQGEFVETETSDGVELVGLLAEPEESEKLVIHFHGMQGNFFQNSFVQEMLTGYPENNIGFLTVEQRGAEAVRYFAKNDDFVNIGNAYEVFEESRYDIQAWIDFAKEKGFEEIYLQSHSLGTMKTAYYLSNKNKPSVSGTIFISPSDMWGLAMEDIENYQELIEEAKQLKKNGREEEILIEDLWGWGYLSAKTFLNFFDEDTKTAVFNYYDPSKGFEVVKEIEVPILAFLGTKDDGIVTDPHESMNMLERKAEANRFEEAVFEGAEHSYEGFEDQLIEKTVRFIQNNRER